MLAKPNATPSRQAGTRSAPRSITRFFKSPKGMLLIVLGLLTGLAFLDVGFSHAWPNVASAMFVAAITDLGLMALVHDEISLPSGALLTGLIVALVLSPAMSPLVAGLTAAIAIASKHLFRTRWSNIFNPAALALVVACFVFGAEESWWGSLPDLPVYVIPVLLAAGVFVADRVNKLPMALTFLGTFFGIFALTAFLGDTSGVQEIFRAPDVNAALFFALFMLDDPPTSPVKYGDQVTYGAIAALISYAVFLALGGVYYLLAGVLFANAWESLRRVEERSGQQSRPPKPTANTLASDTLPV